MKDRNHFIDTIKGLCIIFVILLHYPYKYLDTNQILFPYWVAFAVPCFMFISGYVSSLSFEQKGFEKLKEMYSIRDLICRLLRFVIPFTVAFAAQWILFRLFKVYLVNILTYGLRAFCVDYLTGGKGPGSYYFPITIQFVFLFPVIYATVRKFRLKGLVGIFVVDEIYEIVVALCGMDPEIYRLLIFRYIFAIAAGVYFARVKADDLKSKTVFSAMIGITIVGAFFVWLFSYSHWNVPIDHLWGGTSALSSLFIIPALGISVTRVKRGIGLMELMGKASFNIFLVQMIYFTFFDRISVHVKSSAILFVLTVASCCIIGVLFYMLESRFTKWVVSLVRRNEKHAA